MRPITVRLACISASALAAAGLGSPAGASPTVGFIADASAHGFRSTYTVPGQFVVEQVWDYGGPVAQSEVDPSGGSAFGSLPFPGATAIVGPGLAANLAGLPSPPSYPFYASAQYPSSPSSTVSDPTGSYVLDAQADLTSGSSRAVVLGGPKEAQIASSSARTDVRNADGKVVATAETISRGLNFGDGALTIASATSRSTTILTGGSELQRSSELVLSGLEIDGKPAAPGPDGFDDSAVNEALKRAGISIKIVHQEQSATGATADLLEIALDHPIPGGGEAMGHMVFQFGGASTGILTGTAGADAETTAPDPAPVSSALSRTEPAAETPESQRTSFAPVTRGTSFHRLPTTATPVADPGGGLRQTTSGQWQ